MEVVGGWRRDGRLRCSGYVMGHSLCEGPGVQGPGPPHTGPHTLALLMQPAAGSLSLHHRLWITAAATKEVFVSEACCSSWLCSFIKHDQSHVGVKEGSLLILLRRHFFLFVVVFSVWETDTWFQRGSSLFQVERAVVASLKGRDWL